MHILETPMKAPEIRAERWLYTDQPLSLATLSGHVVLIDFFDYTCLNCLHTLPYLKAWYKRYQDAGFLILGIHSPEFDFAKDFGFVEQGIAPFQLPYPVAIDSEMATWNAYGNRYWPAKYLIDQTGRVRAFHFGEGAYGEMEEAIQHLLQEQQPTLDLPPVLSALSPMDEPTAVCYRPTPELYLGYQRGRLGNRKGYQPGKVVHYELPETYTPELLFLSGEWLNAPEYLEHAGTAPGQIALTYKAAEVNLVLYGAQGPATVWIEQDGAPLRKEAWGADVVADTSGRPCVHVTAPRMLRLVKNMDYGTHSLLLTTESEGLRAYAFTFMSCVSSDNALA